MVANFRRMFFQAIDNSNCYNNLTCFILVRKYCTDIAQVLGKVKNYFRLLPGSMSGLVKIS